MKVIISTEEDERLGKLEGLIQSGLASFVEVGAALTEIRDRRLYRASHKTFEDYCKERWGFKRQHAHRLIEASTIVKGLPENVSNWIQNEAQARELSAVPPEQRTEVLSLASKGGKPPTAKAIRQAAKPKPSERETSLRAMVEIKELPKAHKEDAELIVEAEEIQNDVEGLLVDLRSGVHDANMLRDIGTHMREFGQRLIQKGREFAK